jgi:hypothetical protein
VVHRQRAWFVHCRRARVLQRPRTTITIPCN